MIPSTTAASNHRSKRSVAANTQSITFTLAQTTATGATTGIASSPFALTAGSPGCVSATGGLQCTISVNAVIGTDVYTVATYSSTNAAAGTENGSGAFSIVVQANQANTASLTLNGAVASVILTSALPPASTYGYAVLGLPGQTALPTSAQIYPIALDSSGNIILSPDTYSTPITLELVDANYDDDAVARGPGAAGRLRRTLGAGLPPPYGQLTVTYASYDPVSGTATASAAAGQFSVLVYSPGDIVTLSTTAADVYSEPYSSYVEEYIGVFGTISGGSPSSSNYYDLPPDQIAVAVAPLVSASPSPPALTFTGYAVATPEPTPSAVPSPPAGPQSGLPGFQTPISTYYSNEPLASASLDLSQVTAGDYVFVYLTGLPMGSTALTIGSPSGTCGYISGLSSLLVGSDYVIEFSSSVPAATQENACTITLNDYLNNTATLELYANAGSVTVSGKGRMHR